MTKHPDLFTALAAPFDDRNEVKILSKAGRQLRYITARTAMNRLDAVLGPENWWDDYFPGSESVICRLTIVLPDGQHLTKVDAGGYAGMADSGDDDKSGFSDAFKRAAVKFGVARYLYRDGVPDFAQEQAPGDVPDQRPASPTTPPQPRPEAEARPAATSNGQHSDPPRTGKALFAWAKEMEQRNSVGIIKYINSWAKLQEFPGRMVDWDAEQVRLAHAEAVRKLRAVATPDKATPAPAEAPKQAASRPTATTKEVKRFEEQLNAFCRKMNAAWLDRNTTVDGEIPSWVKDLANPYQIVGHTLKVNGVAFPGGGKHNERMKAAAAIWLADEAGVVREWTAYTGKLAAELKQKHAKDSEEPELVGASTGRTPGCDDDKETGR